MGYASLSTRSLSSACGLGAPLGVKDDVLGYVDFATTSLRTALEAMRSECSPWAVVREDGAPFDTRLLALHAALVPSGERG